MFEAPMLDAIAAFAKSPEFLEGLDPETAGIVLPFLDVFAGEDVDIEKLIADVETIQEIILLLNEKGIIDGDEDTDYLDILFVVHAGESESLIEYIIGELKATSFKDAIVNAFKSLADKDDHGNYKILDGADEIAVTMVAPLLAVVGETANMENIEADMALIVDVVALMYECGLMGEQVGDDEAIVSALFKKPAGEQDNYLAKMFDVFVGTRYDAALTTAITTLLEDELDMSESDPSLVVVINATKTLVGTINELSDIKVDVNAIGDVVMMLEEVFNSDDVDILALLTGDGNGKTIIHEVLDELETSELKQFMLDIVTGLAEGVVNAYDEDAAADAIKITLGELGEPALSFVIAAMEILADIDNIEQLANDVSTIAKVIAILEEEELITDGDKPVDLVALFTEKVEGETVIDKILAVFEENSDLNPLLVVLARSMAEYIDLMDVAAPFDVLVHSIANVFSTSTEETVGDDIATVANVFEILVSEGVLEADNADILVTLTTKDGSGNTVVDRIVDELDSNERTKPIVAEFTKVSLSLIVSGSTEAGGATTPEQKEELEQTYEDVKTGIDEVINVGIQNQDKAPEEQKEIISDKLTEIFNNTLGSTEGGDGDDSGEVPPITDVIDKEIVDSMAGFIVEEYLTKDPEDPESEIKLDDLIGTLYEEVPVVDDDGNQIFDEDGNPETTTQISDAGLADVILNYYEAYLEWLENQNSGN